MKLPVDSLTWMVGCATIYLIAALINKFAFPFTEHEYIEAVWLLVFAMPLFVPMRRIVNVKTLWK